MECMKKFFLSYIKSNLAIDVSKLLQGTVISLQDILVHVLVSVHVLFILFQINILRLTKIETTTH